MKFLHRIFSTVYFYIMNENEHFDLIQKMVHSGKKYDEIKKKLDTILPRNTENWQHIYTVIDDRIIEYELLKQEKSNGLVQVKVGVLLLMLGLIITGFSYFSGANRYILCLGLILVGSFISKEGYKRYTSPEVGSSYSSRRIKNRKRRRFE